jgi:hypothetical protein
MRFSTVSQGTRAERAASFKHGTTVVNVLLRPLTAAEEIEVISKATALAESKGIKNPRPDNPIYESAIWAHSLALACLDPDSPTDARAPTFDGGAEQALAALDSDTLAVLYEQLRVWQEECSPSLRTVGTDALWNALKEVATSDDPFVYARLSPHMRWTLQRFTAALLLKSPGARPFSSSDSGDSSSSTTTPSSPAKSSAS